MKKKVCVFSLYSIYKKFYDPSVFRIDDVMFAPPGTIDKAYPRSTGGYAFEICGPAAATILQRANVDNRCFEVLTVCKEDSQDITNSHRYWK